MPSEHFLRTIIDHIDEGVLCIEKGIVIWVNRAMETMTGLDRDNLTGCPLTLLFDPPAGSGDYRMAGNPGTAGEGPAVVAESCLKTSDGRLRDVAITVHILPQGKIPIEIMVVRDIAERKKMQKDLLKSRQLESIAALSGGIAHDYNNLLTAIMGNISLALTAIADDDPMYEWLSQAQDAALIAKELTNRLITFSKGGAPLKEAVDIAELVEGATHFALSGSNINAAFDIPSDLWCVDADRTQIGQAFHNLVINAREAMPEGGIISVHAENRTSTSDEALIKAGRYVVVSIEDQGGGIAPEALDRIFDPYFSTKEMGGQRGMGLGLSIANSIIAQHDGKIAVEAPPGEGACFKVFLPACGAVSPTVDIAEPARRSPKSVLGGRILVMDDEEMIRKLAHSMLAKLGFETAFASNGEEAIAAYAAAMEAGRPFDLVILDLTVKGGMGGKEAIGHLSAMDPDVKAIVSSGYANDPGVTRFSEYGFCGVVAKPYRFDEIRRKLEAILGA